MIKLSVIIPTFNRRQVIERSLTSITAQDLPPEDFEVIVVVDGSTDGTAEFLRNFKMKCTFRVLSAAHRGPGAARNVGIRAAIGKLVLFLDDDIIAPPDLFRKHCASHIGSECCVMHGPLYVAEGSSETIIRHILEIRCEDYYRELAPDSRLRYPDEIESSIGVLSALANSSMPRELLLRCGGFDEQILAGEDLEFGLRLWKAGATFRYLPEAIAREHYVKGSYQYLQGQASALGAGDVLISRKHAEYRPYSLLSSFAETRVPKRLVLRAITRLPFSPASFLYLPLKFEKWFYRSGPLRNAGVRLLRVAERVTVLRGALAITGSWKALRAEFGRRLPVMMYHHVGPLRPGTYPSLTVSPKNFERQIRWLAHCGYVGIQPSQWLRWRRDGTELPDKPILITFDDAYEDITEYALPILRRFGFGAAVYVVTGRLGGTNSWDEADGCGTLKLMSADQVRYWAGQGIEFGPHSQTHADLTKLSEAECEAEIVGSKNDLVALLGSPIVSFAYPFGECNNYIRDLVREHFELGFGTEEGMNYLRSDPHILRRTYVGPKQSLFSFFISVRRGGKGIIRYLRAKFGVRTRLKRILGRL